MAKLSEMINNTRKLARDHFGEYVEAAFWLVVWLLVSPLVMFSIKHLTSAQELHFPYPWLLIGFSNLGTFLLLSASVLCFPKLWPDRSSRDEVHWKYASVLGILQGFEVGIGATIIYKISLALRTEIHMLSPVFMFIVGCSCGIERPTVQLVLAVVFVAIGGLLVCYGSLTWEGLNLVPLALVMALISTLRWVLTQKWLAPILAANLFGASRARSASAPILALRMSPATSLVGFCVALAQERGAFAGLLHQPHAGQVVLLLCAISLGVSCILVAEMRAVQLTSALLMSFFVPFHNVTVILMDVVVKGARVSVVNWLGIVMVAIATGFYSLARKESRRDLTAPPGHQTAALSYRSTGDQQTMGGEVSRCLFRPANKLTV
mmetsp:Transcript_1727/g.1789  ORF Transcript_1727/g.1789 Transcript_1727/m.1789 type:complete len:378 (+) Transcript_1727:84-1217(+)